jgi:hypothetical protein
MSSIKGTTVKKIATLIILSVFISGCVSTPEYVKNLKPDEYLFSKYVDIDQAKDLESIALAVGSDRTGFIKPDRSESRKNFEMKYPISAPSLDKYDDIEGIIKNRKIGQVLRLSADLDKRTSGFIKDENGLPISVSGMVKLTAEPIVSAALSGAGGQLIATSTSSASSINPSQSAGYNIGAGLGLGILVGGIHSLQSDAALRGIISKEDFGSRMEEATAVPSMPTATRLSPDGVNNRGRIAPIKVADGIVKVVYQVVGEKTLRYQDKIFLLSTVAAYRGDSYKMKYPETEGWEFRITNINLIEIPESEYGEPRFRAIRKVLLEKGIKL